MGFWNLKNRIQNNNHLYQQGQQNLVEKQEAGHLFPCLVKHTVFCSALLSPTIRNKHKTMKITRPSSSSHKDIDTRAVRCEILTVLGANMNLIQTIIHPSNKNQLCIKKSINFCIHLWISHFDPPHCYKKIHQTREKEERKGKLIWLTSPNSKDSPKLMEQNSNKSIRGLQHPHT